MLARLWWKEFRLFWPIWLLLTLAAGLLQWVLLSINSEDARSGGLTIAALCWSVLYAFAASSAAFAGEREANTLGFLDALPVARRTLWFGKASFVLASTFGLTMLMVGLAALGTEKRPSSGSYSYPQMTVVFGTGLFAAVAWGLFWSALSRSALLAGAMAVVSVAASPMVVSGLRDPEIVVVILLLAALALGASGLVMTWRPTGIRRIVRRRRKAPGPIGLVALRASSTGRSLIWQSRREGWTTWLVVLLVGLGAPTVLTLLEMRIDALFATSMAVLASLVAGVSVFGVENSTASRRFLVHHAVRPGTVWAWKLLVWGLFLASFLGLIELSNRYLGGPYGGWRSREIGLPDGALRQLAIASINAFAVGLVCGMAIHRRITAALVGVIWLILLVPLQIGLEMYGMIPRWSLGLVPLILVAISGAWARDWLLQREGPWPWVRIGLLIIVPFGLLGVSYPAYRAFEVPDVGPRNSEVLTLAATIPAGEDAAEVYRRASRLIEPRSIDLNRRNSKTSASVDFVIESGWYPDQSAVVDWWKANQPAIDLARKASAMSQARFMDFEGATLFSTQGDIIVGLRTLGLLLAVDTRERLARGDLPGAWDDILTQFRLVEQLRSNTPTMSQLRLAAEIHHWAVGLGFDWLADPRQTPETIRRALADLKALRLPPNLADGLRVESWLIERTLDLSGKDLATFLLQSNERQHASTFDFFVVAKLVAAPWERQRARRICRLIVAEEMPVVSVEPYRRGREVKSVEWNVPGFENTSLVRRLMPSITQLVDNLDRELVGRLALLQAVALVGWKLDHGGESPKALDELVPTFLEQVPLDPYSGRLFGYIRSEGQRFLPPIFHEVKDTTTPRQTKSGRYLLYSVGSDRTDNRGEFLEGVNPPIAKDYVFEVP